ncbi:hypothetical protein ONZ45_g7333 [Pleurotus djamor]|nr:hypothetical protein ONZ45_g7333 [Pleurotus djamor]
MSTLSVAVGAILCVLVVDRLLKVIVFRKKIDLLPRMKCAFAPMEALGVLIPTCRLNPGIAWPWFWKDQVYSKYRAETISVLPLLSGKPSIYTRSIEVAKQIASTQRPFKKAEDANEVISVWGPNVFAANGADWRRHRRIMAPAFSSNTYSLIREEVSSLYQDICAAEGWNKSDVVTIPSISHLTIKLTLLVITRCGFGKAIPWKFESEDTEMNFAEALTIVSDTSVAKAILPGWIFKLPVKRLQDIDKAFRLLKVFMKDLIETRRHELAVGESADRSDVFSLLIQASEAEGKMALTDNELSGNTFLMLLAGHESTAHALDATVFMLALHQDIQQEVFEEIRSQELKTSDLMKHPKLKHASSKPSECFTCHALPSFAHAGLTGWTPAVGYVITRDAAEDLILKTYDENGVAHQVPVEKGTRLVVDLVGIHSNPRHFPQPEAYRPSRWHGVSENDISMFSVGSRACIGRRFAITEAVSFLSAVLKDWRIEPAMNSARETKAEWKERVLKGVQVNMTLGVGPVAIRLVRRK